MNTTTDTTEADANLTAALGAFGLMDGTLTELLVSTTLPRPAPHAFQRDERVQCHQLITLIGGSVVVQSGSMLMQRVERAFAHQMNVSSSSMADAFRPRVTKMEFTDSTNTVVETVVYTPSCD